MTVEELIKKLGEYPLDKEVISRDNSGTFWRQRVIVREGGAPVTKGKLVIEG
jgi:hypothetical protein